ncbi:unnamed protein product [Meganyctiphanes norvegica]|uniref:Transposase n=1 Tax=Meganyctiphanes norvegica TaxID=48144 RepID=A0AAV2RF46_MEGNR
MPPKVKIRRSYAQYTDEDLEAAIEKYRSGKGILSIRAVGREFQIPSSTLRAKLRETRPKKGKAGRRTLLTQAEELLLLNFIKESAKRALPVTRLTVMRAVRQITSEDAENDYPRDNFFPNSSLLGWWKGYTNRYPMIVYRTPENLSTAQKSVRGSIVKQWFSDVVSYLSENNLADILDDHTRIYNLDETGFSISPNSGKVLPVKGDKLCFAKVSKTAKKNAKKNITMLCTVRADGVLVPPMIIYPRKNTSVGIATQIGKVPEQYEFTVGQSDKGYITFESFYEYMINDFDTWLDSNNVKKPIIVFTDWHETRNNYHLSRALDAMGIYMIGLLPNTTHLLQPLGLAVFKPLKTGWSKAARAHVVKYDEYVNQATFANVAIPLCYEKITKENIVRGFEKCGLYPFESESPDYTKLLATAAQRKSNSTIFEGINHNGVMERSTQTKQPTPTQESNPAKEMLKVAYPCFSMESKDDMVSDLARYAPWCKMIRSMKFDVPCKSTSLSSASKQAIIPAFDKYKFFPEKREGKTEPG